MESNSQSSAAPRPDWTYSVPPPRTLSALWLFERLVGLSIPIAVLTLLAAAKYLDLITLQ
ncbi:MAG TPA: hypothetical protein VGZ72_12555 [Stellaceae bacterium]|jgi:hypothetical protein|nr:hypothetical protein [Stellaceae bacterium]